MITRHEDDCMASPSKDERHFISGKWVSIATQTELLHGGLTSRSAVIMQLQIQQRNRPEGKRPRCLRTGEKSCERTQGDQDGARRRRAYI